MQRRSQQHHPEGIPLLPGETPIQKAPKLVLEDGTNCIPQHYLHYRHSLESVQTIISYVSFDPNYVFFVDRDKQGIYLQLGIIGVDNYCANQTPDSKIVYGRKWRIESWQPSSEIIQTAFLAAQKAREHEIRELFKFRDQQKTTTPFSCHQDLPLLSLTQISKTKSTPTLCKDRDAVIQNLLAKIEYNGLTFSYQKRRTITEDTIALVFNVDGQAATALPELETKKEIVLLVNEIEENAILFALIDKFICLSNRYVEEHFCFKGFNRFSRNNDVQSIANISMQTRHKRQLTSDQELFEVFSNTNYETDVLRVPRVFKGVLGDRIKEQLANFEITDGIPPKNG